MAALGMGRPLGKGTGVRLVLPPGTVDGKGKHL